MGSPPLAAVSPSPLRGPLQTSPPPAPMQEEWHGPSLAMTYAIFMLIYLTRMVYTNARKAADENREMLLYSACPFPTRLTVFLLILLQTISSHKSNNHNHCRGLGP
jgi:hypothetical protein